MIYYCNNFVFIFNNNDAVCIFRFIIIKKLQVKKNSLLPWQHKTWYFKRIWEIFLLAFQIYSWLQFFLFAFEI